MTANSTLPRILMGTMVGVELRHCSVLRVGDHWASGRHKTHVLPDEIQNSQQSTHTVNSPMTDCARPTCGVRWRYPRQETAICKAIATNAPSYVTNKQIQDHMEVSLFEDCIKALTEWFNCAGNPRLGQLGRQLCGQRTDRSRLMPLLIVTGNLKFSWGHL